jgi:signal transduction histidine kinase
LEDELSGICLALQPEGENNSALNAEAIARHLKAWRQTASHSALVSEVFLWDGSPNSAPTAISASGMRRSAWPAELDSLPAELTRKLNGQNPPPPDHGPSQADLSSNSPALSFGPRFGWLFDQQRLVLLHPALSGSIGQTQQMQWLVVPLSRNFFTGELLPELTRNEFGSHSATYQMAVILEGETATTLYSSQPGFAFSQSDPRDASLNLFGAPSMIAGSGSPHAHEMVFPVGADASVKPPRLFIEPLVPSPPGPVLTVIARHRRGSLDAAVARLRQRNLAVGFGVLGVLAVTLTLVIVTSHRARILAQMQMDFVAGVSHELRTPLTAILLAARNIEDGVVGANGLVRYGAAIKSHAAQLSELVEEILLFTETHSGRHIYKIESFDVALGIQNTLDSLAPIVDASGFRLEETIAPDLPLVQGDPAAFSQSLQNLVVNSIKYGGDARWVGVKAFIGENGSGKSREVCVSVEDRGLGIAERELEKIFEPFYRSPQVVNAQIMGNGLGLPLTRTMIEAIGGKLTVASELGKGSAFTIHLRVAPSIHPKHSQSG